MTDKRSKALEAHMADIGGDAAAFLSGWANGQRNGDCEAQAKRFSSDEAQHSFRAGYYAAKEATDG